MVSASLLFVGTALTAGVSLFAGAFGYAEAAGVASVAGKLLFVTLAAVLVAFSRRLSHTERFHH